MLAPAIDRSRNLGLGWGLLSLATLALAPAGPWLAQWLWSCPFKVLTGWPCPACGITRAALALGRFEVVEALTLYPLQTLGWIVFVGGGLVVGAFALAGRPLPVLPLPELPRWVVALLLLAVVTNWGYCIATGV